MKPEIKQAKGLDETLFYSRRIDQLINKIISTIPVVNSKAWRKLD